MVKDFHNRIPYIGFIQSIQPSFTIIINVYIQFVNVNKKEGDMCTIMPQQCFSLNYYKI